MTQFFIHIDGRHLGTEEALAFADDEELKDELTSFAQKLLDELHESFPLNPEITVIAVDQERRAVLRIIILGQLSGTPLLAPKLTSRTDDTGE
ncbi:hypothetical protein SAMN05216548_12325 [Faunimonas pinastri]|uniref:Uncharacterized protein n=1 Tax=Faunimonas pinastri TaxID=1855383 RepID=A0A1H9PXB2_9HYPH|nr:hypothetical protein [Faunimonas pinastri]SER52758.1 hypothetical protein SAMN05216548_12325 [Faunimonas pinastri]